MPASTRTRASEVSHATSTHGPRAPRARSRADIIAIKGRLLDRLMEELGRQDLPDYSETSIASAVQGFVGRLLESAKNTGPDLA